MNKVVLSFERARMAVLVEVQIFLLFQKLMTYESCNIFEEGIIHNTQLTDEFVCSFRSCNFYHMVIPPGFINTWYKIEHGKQESQIF